MRLPTWTLDVETDWIWEIDPDWALFGAACTLYALFLLVLVVIPIHRSVRPY